MACCEMPAQMQHLINVDAIAIEVERNPRSAIRTKMLSEKTRSLARSRRASLQ